MKEVITVAGVCRFKSGDWHQLSEKFYENHIASDSRNASL